MHTTRTLFSLACGLGLACAAWAQLNAFSVLYEHRDPVARFLGSACLGLTDINNDGYADYALGEPGANSNHAQIMVMSGRNGVPLWTRALSQNDTGFGGYLFKGADYDGDGHPDILAGEPGFSSGTGRLQILSAKTGATLATLLGKATGDGFGVQAVDLGDVNKDNKPDLLITSIDYPSSAAWGRVETISGADFTTVLAAQFGSGAGARFGSGIAACGDVDADTYPDYVIGEPGAASNTGIVRQYSGRFRTILKTVTFPTSDRFGERITAIGDTNGDGEQDLLVSQYGSSNGGGHCYGAKSLSLLFTVPGGGYGVWGRIALPLGDLDQDGGNDFALATPTLKNTYGQVTILSGKTQAQLRVLQGFEYPGGFGSSIGTCDVDGDGRPDLIVGQPGSLNMGAAVGQACWVYTLKQLALSTPTGHTISIANGGLVNYAIDAGPARAGQAYVLVGSMTGTKPGFPLWSLQIPLNIDPYLSFTAGTVNSPILPNSFGMLDGNGRATCTFQILPGILPIFAGTIFDHAALVLCSNLSCVHSVTNARPVTLRL